MSTFIVRNLSAVNGRRFIPRRVWRKKTGPGDSRRMRTAATAKIGAVTMSRTPAPTMSTSRFARSDVRDRRAGGTVTSGSPSIEMDVRSRPEELVEPRDDVDDHVPVPERADEQHGPARPLAGERHDHALDPVLDDQGVEVAQAAENGKMIHLGTPRSWILVDESDETHPVLGMLLNLARDELADVARHRRRRSSGRTLASLRARARTIARPLSTNTSASVQNVTRRPELWV